MISPGILASSSLILTPLQLSGLQCWVDANDPAGNGTQPATGSAFATWVDKSGLGNNFVQATGVNQPLFITGVQNGLPGIRFDGSNDAMHCNALTSIMNGTDKVCTVFAVCIPRNSATTRTLWAWTNGGVVNTSNAAFQHRINTGGSWGLVKRDNTATLVNNIAGTYALATPYISVVQINSGGLTADVTINATKIMNDVDIDLGACTMTLFYFGSFIGSNGGVQWWNGDILEFFVLDTVATDDQIKVAKNYLSQKWSIAI